jgi:hypothetical protein
VSGEKNLGKCLMKIKPTNLCSKNHTKNLEGLPTTVATDISVHPDTKSCTKIDKTIVQDESDAKGLIMWV